MWSPAERPCHVLPARYKISYICTSLWTISSLVMRCVVRLRSCIRVLRLCDHSLRISLDSLCALKVTMPAGRSILANTVLDTTNSDRNNSVSWKRNKGKLSKQVHLLLWQKFQANWWHFCSNHKWGIFAHKGLPTVFHKEMVFFMQCTKSFIGRNKMPRQTCHKLTQNHYYLIKKVKWNPAIMPVCHIYIWWCE